MVMQEAISFPAHISNLSTTESNRYLSRFPIRKNPSLPTEIGRVCHNSIMQESVYLAVRFQW